MTIRQILTKVYYLGGRSRRAGKSKLPEGGSSLRINVLLRVVLFDFDGVIADSLEVFAIEFRMACEAIGARPPATRNDLLAIFDQNALLGMIKAGIPLRKLREMGRQFGPRMVEAMDRIAPFEGMPALLNELAAAVPVYVVTSNATATVRDYLARHDVGGVRDVIGADKEPSKVKKIRQIRKKHPRTRIYYVGDTKGDMLEGNTARAITVAVTWGWHSEARLCEGKPKHIVRTPDDLRALFLE